MPSFRQGQGLGHSLALGLKKENYKSSSIRHTSTIYIYISFILLIDRDYTHNNITVIKIIFFTAQNIKLIEFCIGNICGLLDFGHDIETTYVHIRNFVTYRT